MKIFHLSVLTAVLALALGTGLTRGDTAPAKKGAEPRVTLPPGVLDSQALETMLKNIGYTPRLEKFNGADIYWVEVDRQGVRYTISFQVSPNNEKIWAIVSVSDINIKTASADRLARLLELNDTIGPCYFRYNAANKRLYMCRPLDNRGVTAAVFLDNLDRLVDRLVETKSDWMVKNWAEPIKPDAQAKK